MTREMKQIFTRRITQANSTQLIVILYDMTLTYLKDANTAQQIGCDQEYKKAVQCARNCIAELRNSLDFTYDLSRNLFALYVFADKELAGNRIQEVVKILKKLRDAYHSVSKQDDSQPLMQNTQDVYAGFTYGRTDVNENLINYSGARGYCV